MKWATPLFCVRLFVCGAGIGECRVCVELNDRVDFRIDVSDSLKKRSDDLFRRNLFSANGIRKPDHRFVDQFIMVLTHPFTCYLGANYINEYRSLLFINLSAADDDNGPSLVHMGRRHNVTTSKLLPTYAGISTIKPLSTCRKLSAAHRFEPVIHELRQD